MMPAANIERFLEPLIAVDTTSSADPAADRDARPGVELWQQLAAGIGATTTIYDNPLRPDKPVVVSDVGDGSPAVVLAGHLDTVPAAVAQWSSDPWTLARHGDHWTGLGVADMKGFFAVGLAVLQDLAGRLSGAVRFVATFDEESGMEGARALGQVVVPPDATVILGEPTGSGRCCGSKGISVFHVNITGEGGHASLMPRPAAAVDGTRHILNQLADWQQNHAPGVGDDRFEPPMPSCNVGRIAGGDIFNRIAPAVDLDLEFRLLPGFDDRAARAVLDRAADSAQQATGVRVQFDNRFAIPPFAGGQLDEQGTGGVSFATEAAFLAAAGQPLTIWGPGEIQQAHVVDEQLSIAATERFADELAQFLLKVCG